MNWQEHITTDADVCRGKPCFRGTRVLVSVILDNLTAGVPESEILESYPSLDESSLRAAIAYAAALTVSRRYFEMSALLFAG